MTNQWELTLSATYTIFIFPQHACFVAAIVEQDAKDD